MPTTTTTTTTSDGTATTTTTVTTSDSIEEAETPQKKYGEVLASGFTFGEGPRIKDGKLYMVDMCGFEPDTHQSETNGALGDHGFVWCVDLETGSKRRYACLVDAPPSGLGWLPDGRMLVVHTQGLELQVETAPGSAIFVKHCDVSPGAGRADDFLNDMVVGFDGTAYVVRASLLLFTCGPG